MLPCKTKVISDVELVEYSLEMDIDQHHVVERFESTYESFRGKFIGVLRFLCRCPSPHNDIPP